MSRIHDALKKAEAERRRADAAEKIRAYPEVTGPETGSGEASHPPTAHSAQPAVPSRVDEFTDASRAGRSGNLGKSAGPEGKATSPAAARAPHKLSACDATLLKQCAQFDWALDDQPMLSSAQSKYRIGAEEFRTLRSSLELVRKQQPLKSILITSPSPKEGKTFVAANLSQAIVWQHENRVLLIDGDLRLSRVHKYFGNLSQEPGLADYLSGEADPIALIRRSAANNFFILPAGRRVVNALELIGNGRLKPLIQWLAPAFDWIIIDSPPSAPVSDARLIAECCDGILMVVRAGATPFDLAKRSAGEIRGKRYLGVVLNAVDAGLTASSYYYSSNGHGSDRE